MIAETLKLSVKLQYKLKIKELIDLLIYLHCENFWKYKKIEWPNRSECLTKILL